MKKNYWFKENRTKTYKNGGWGLGLAPVLAKDEFRDLGLVWRPILILSFLSQNIWRDWHNFYILFYFFVKPIKQQKFYFHSHHLSVVSLCKVITKDQPSCCFGLKRLGLVWTSKTNYLTCHKIELTCNYSTTKLHIFKMVINKFCLFVIWFVITWHLFLGIRKIKITKFLTHLYR